MHTILVSINCIGKGIVDIHTLSVVITSNDSQADTGKTNRECNIIAKSVSPLSQWGYYDVPAGTYIAFPVSFTSFCYKMTSYAFFLSTKNIDENKSLSGIKLDTTGYYYIVIGK